MLQNNSHWVQTIALFVPPKSNNFRICILNISPPFPLLRRTLCESQEHFDTFPSYSSHLCCSVITIQHIVRLYHQMSNTVFLRSPRFSYHFPNALPSAPACYIDHFLTRSPSYHTTTYRTGLPQRCPPWPTELDTGRSSKDPRTSRKNVPQSPR